MPYPAFRDGVPVLDARPNRAHSVLARDRRRLGMLYDDLRPEERPHLPRLELT